MQCELTIRKRVHCVTVQADQRIAGLNADVRGSRAFLHGVHEITAINVERDANIFRERINPEIVAIPFSSGLEVGPSKLIDLMAMDAVLPLTCSRGWHLFDEYGRSTARRLFTRGGFVPDQRLLGRIFQTGKRDSTVVAAGITATIPTIDHFVGTHEEGKPGAVEVEFKESEIDPSDAHESDANKAVGNFVQRLGETNNLFVEFGAVNSRLASEGHEHWLAGSLGFGLRSRIVGVPADLRRPLGKGGSNYQNRC